MQKHNSNVVRTTWSASCPRGCPPSPPRSDGNWESCSRTVRAAARPPARTSPCSASPPAQAAGPAGPRRSPAKATKGPKAKHENEHENESGTRNEGLAQAPSSFGHTWENTPQWHLHESQGQDTTHVVNPLVSCAAQ